jgi:DNA primase
MFDAKNFLLDRGHKFKIKGAEVSSNWIGISCPMCGDSPGKTHGAFSLKYGNYNCWKCGKHPVYKVIAELENCSYREAFELIQKYSNFPQYEQQNFNHATSLDVAKVAHAQKMKKHHRLYLQKRNFDDSFLEKEYGLLGTDILGNYTHRIVAPILLNGKEVSFQARTIVNREPKYLSCAREKEVIHYKHTLYNIDKVKNNIILVEGITSVWRIGPGAVASFGVSITEKQVILLLTKAIQNDSMIFVCFDPEPTAQRVARKLVSNIKSIYDKCKNILISDEFDDPAEMPNDDIKVFRKELKL